MSELSPVLVQFLEAVKENQCIWGLQDADGEGWVVGDSVEFEDTEVMPLWSTEAMAKSHCSGDWADYQATSLPLTEYLEDWVEDLSQDQVLVVLDWNGDEEGIEIEPVELAKLLMDIEQLPQ